MNQILVTQKLYVTPELKRKKKIYKFEFLLSIFVIIVLISVYIYAECDRNKSEETSQGILADMYSEEKHDEDITLAKDDSVLIVVLDENAVSEEDIAAVQENNTSGTTSSARTGIKKTSDGYSYTSVATISIPKINLNYPILEGQTGSVEETDSLLKISPCKFWGPNVNEVGNYCIVGHNWRNSKFFSKVPTLGVGDTITITEPNVRTITYSVYDKYTVEPQNLSCTSQLTGGKKEITLITCTDNSEGRVIIKAREIK